MTTTETDVVRVKARGNVLGLVVGQIAEMPSNYPELADCLLLGTVVRLDAEGNEIDPPEGPPRRPCGCGR